MTTTCPQCGSGDIITTLVAMLQGQPDTNHLHCNSCNADGKICDLEIAFVYAVEGTEYDDHWTNGIFSTRQKAQDYIEMRKENHQKFRDLEVITYKLDDPDWEEEETTT